jgi:nitrate reductase gamma subunit
MSNFGYVSAAIGAFLIAVVALFLGWGHPQTAAILLVAAVATLAGLGLAWRKRIKRQRRRRSSTRLRI